MFTKVLVTVDGSDLSERALGPAFDVAQQYGATIIILRVLTADAVALAGGLSPQYFELRSRHEQHERQEAGHYLEQLRATWAATGVATETCLATGAAPEAILEAAEGAGVDLIVMSTHGRTGLSRLLYGSVAEAVLRATRWPVLLIPVR
jgi:nucleotide-binding universal stress UspA family protein